MNIAELQKADTGYHKTEQGYQAVSEHQYLEKVSVASPWIHYMRSIMEGQFVIMLSSRLRFFGFHL